MGRAGDSDGRTPSARDMIFGNAGRARASAWKFQQTFEYQKIKPPWDEVAPELTEEPAEEPAKKRAKKQERPLPVEEQKQTRWGEWVSATADDGCVYYYNCVTQHSTWEKPPAVIAAEVQHNGAALGGTGEAPRPETIPSMSADEQSGAKLCVKPAWADRVGEVQWWYYKDAQGMPQGPHYPGQMRHWYTAGHFRSTQEIAPSFMGEVPQAYAPIFVVFKEPVEETAFVAGEGIANFAPTADEPVVEKSEVSRARLIRSLMNHVSQGSDEKEMGWC